MEVSYFLTYLFISVKKGWILEREKQEETPCTVTIFCAFPLTPTSQDITETYAILSCNKVNPHPRGLQSKSSKQKDNSVVAGMTIAYISLSCSFSPLCEFVRLK